MKRTKHKLVFTPNPGAGLGTSMTAKAEILRKVLNLESGIWKQLPNELVNAPFVARDGTTPKALLSRLHTSYKLFDNEMLEFLGDAVLELIITQIVFQHIRSIVVGGKRSEESVATDLRSLLVKNVSLECYMRIKSGDGTDLCSQIYSKTLHQKQCADVFEAIIGVLYYWCRDIKRLPNAYEVVEDWFIATWNITTIMDNYRESGIVSCNLAAATNPVSPEIEQVCGRRPSIQPTTQPSIQTVIQPSIQPRVRQPIPILPPPAKQPILQPPPTKQPIPEKPTVLRKKPASPLITAALPTPPKNKSPEKATTLKKKPTSPQVVSALPTPPKKKTPEVPTIRTRKESLRRAGIETKSPQKEYEKMTVLQLRQLLRDKGLPHTGLKKDLVARLVAAK